MVEKKRIKLSILRIFSMEEEEESKEEYEVAYQKGVYYLKNNFNKFNEEKKKGISTIEVSVVGDVNKIISQLEYRLVKEKLNPIENALLFNELEQLYNTSATNLAKRLNKTIGDVSNKKRLLKLPIYIQSDIISNKLTERHGRALLQLITKGEKEKVKEVYDEIVFKQLKVSDAEKLINKALGKKIEKKEIIALDKSSLKNRLAVPVINQIELDLDKTLELIEKYYPQIEVLKEEGLEGSDYILKLSIKNVK